MADFARRRSGASEGDRKDAESDDVAPELVSLMAAAFVDDDDEAAAILAGSASAPPLEALQFAQHELAGGDAVQGVEDEDEEEKGAVVPASSTAANADAGRGADAGGAEEVSDAATDVSVGSRKHDLAVVVLLALLGCCAACVQPLMPGVRRRMTRTVGAALVLCLVAVVVLALVLTLSNAPNVRWEGCHEWRIGTRDRHPLLLRPLPLPPSPPPPHCPLPSLSPVFVDRTVVVAASQWAVDARDTLDGVSQTAMFQCARAVRAARPRRLHSPHRHPPPTRPPARQDLAGERGGRGRGAASGCRGRDLAAGRGAGAGRLRPARLQSHRRQPRAAPVALFGAAPSLVTAPRELQRACRAGRGVSGRLRGRGRGCTGRVLDGPGGSASAVPALQGEHQHPGA